jgi:putative ABC transport system permease protein
MLLPQDTLRIALGALSANKLRTALTLLGLVIGVTSLILVMTLIQGANVFVQSKIANLGPDIFQVSKEPLASKDFNEVLRARRHKDITSDDWRAIRDLCRLCLGVAAQVHTSAHVRNETQNLPDVDVRGETANMVAISTLDIASGRFFSEGEQRAAATVAVIGSEVADKLFGARPAIGKTLRVAGAEFTVVGVNEPIGSLLGQDQDNFVVVPLPAFEKLFGTRNSLILHIKSRVPLGPTQDEVRLILRPRRHLSAEAADDFYFATADTYLDLWRDISSIFFLVFVLISLVASAVGGIVIMNITLVSISERTREIGLRRSVGATQLDIARQFLAEVLAQCLAGGLAGVTLGFAVALALSQLTPFPASVKPWVALLGLGLASAIALIFGIYPAMRAARLDPVVALRSE